MKNVGILLAVFILLICKISQAQPIPVKVASLIQQNTSESLLQAGLIYENGEGVQRDIVEAARLYLLSASKGNFHAHYALWDLWEDFSARNAPRPPFSDPYQFKKSGDAAITGYKNLVRKYQNDAEIHYRLSRLYDPGIGIEGKERKLHMKHLKRAAQLNHKEAIKSLKFENELKREFKK